MNFPQYRKLNNGKVYYKIMDNTSMIEVGVMGMNWWMNDVHAKILPERVMIKDLLELANEGIEEVDEMAFNSFVEDCELNKKKILV